jgi:Domain of unknown function (DUF1844)
MTDQNPDSGFHVRDRRRRHDDEPSPSVEERRQSTERGGEPSGPQGQPLGGPSASPPQSATPSLVGLFMMLASFALAALEGVRDPASGQTHKDPHQAAELIDTLILLRERTEGRRTPEESQALDELLYDLQLRCVRATTSS